MKNSLIEGDLNEWINEPRPPITRNDYQQIISEFMNPDSVDIIEIMNPQGVILINIHDYNLEKFKEMVPHIESRKSVYHQVYYALSPK